MMPSITCSVGVVIDSSVIGLDEAVLVVVSVADDVGSSGSGRTMSAGSMLLRRVPFFGDEVSVSKEKVSFASLPFFNTCSRSAVLATHICKSENLAAKTLRLLCTLLRFGILRLSVMYADERQVSSVPMTDAERDGSFLFWWKLHVNFSVDSSAAACSFSHVRAVD